MKKQKPEQIGKNELISMVDKLKLTNKLKQLLAYLIVESDDNYNINMSFHEIAKNTGTLFVTVYSRLHILRNAKFITLTANSITILHEKIQRKAYLYDKNEAIVANRIKEIKEQQKTV